MNEHVLGHPALLVAEEAGDAECENIFCREGVAAVTGAEGPDGVVGGEVADIAAVGVDVAEAVEAAGPLGAAGHGAVGVVGVAELLPGDNAHAGHHAHADGERKRESVSWMPTLARGEPGGPMRKGTTYMVRPRMQPAKRGRSLA